MFDMCLSKRQIASITNAVAEVLSPEAQVWLFGSRVDDSANGGDIDLLVRPDPTAGNPELIDKVRLLGQLERTLGERRIDSVIETPGDSRPIVRIAHEKGVPLLQACRHAYRDNLRVKELLKKAAAAAHKNVSEFLLDAGMNAAHETLAGRQIYRLDESRWQEFQQALDRPVTPKPRLAKLLSEFSVLEASKDDP